MAFFLAVDSPEPLSYTQISSGIARIANSQTAELPVSPFTIRTPYNLYLRLTSL